jgi:hypothetical protein
MSQAQAAAAVDRLPWLEDEPKTAATRPKRERRSNREFAGWAVAAILLVAGISYWLGVHSWQASPESKVIQTATTVAVPKAHTALQPSEQPQPQILLEPQPEVAPAPIHEVRVSRPRAQRRSPERHVRIPPRHERRSPVPQKIASAPKPALQAQSPLVLWPASQSLGARGRIVRIGAFGSREQAKLGWRYMVEAYPAVAHLPATVVESRNSRGRPFYRFQIGTTSQAHSEVLCQRMGRIRFSCAVVGLPWKPKGVER